MWNQKTPRIAKAILSKERSRRHIVLNFKFYYKVKVKQHHTGTKADVLTNGIKRAWKNKLQELSPIKGELFLTNGSGKTIYQHIKD